MNKRNRYLLAIGMLCLSAFFTLIHFTDTDGFFLGMLIGLGLAFILSGTLYSAKQHRK